ncbi:phosphate/phosphite/phosphonate ABC transporter substrate-binding protein [Paenibacillus humicola]|uniref:phosphate/phosphite/phosphonate ABC transporter substrate-binding protein n=1 Tax=Paenibacillus humicola TaxID=3110540 RepID=UPI00237ACCC2|nr:PhnD/SsuA/transferrin family substrate-binding protein [Paenibacillus humicola]
MKKRKWLPMMSIVLVTGLLAGCGSGGNNGGSGGTSSEAPSNAGGSAGGAAAKEIKDLKVSFVPSKDPDQIITTTAPLKELLINQLGTEGYKVDKVDINVGTTYEAVGEALEAGSTDVGLIPGGTYVLYDDGADVILTATRSALSNDSDNPKDWNDHKPTTNVDKQATYYRSLFIAGPTKKGKELADKVNSGQELTWDDLNSANWSVMTSSSSAGYIYPSLWLQNKYGKSLTDLAHVVQSDSYDSSFARLATGQADVILVYADARMDNEKNWTSKYSRKASIWDETNVIGVTEPIYNDTISVSKNSPIMTDEFKKALQDAFIAIAKTDEGKKVIAIYSHEGYQVAKSSDYDAERKAQELLKSLR